jgi:hypothetical protein
MAYTIVKSDGVPLTTIADGTINTTSTSLGLPGRNYAGYGQIVDTNQVHILENFAASAPPANPLRGQLWYNITNSTLYVCPTQGETNASNWLTLTSTGSGGTTTFGNASVTGNVTSNNISASNQISANLFTSNYLTVSTGANIANANLSGTTTVASLTSANITTGATSTNGNLTGTWTVTGNGTANSVNGTALWVTGGNLVITGTGPTAGIGIKTDHYYYANGVAISFSGTYSDSNVAAYLPTYVGNVGLAGGATIFNGTTLSTGASSTAGTIVGNWSLGSGSKLRATYADLAERFAADAVYEAGTVVQLGGEHEITAVQVDLSEDVFGVVSNTAAYLMNDAAGDDSTHPPIALAGRVKVKMTGSVKKGDRLVSAGNGIARAALPGEATHFNVFGRALEDKTTDGIEHVEAFVAVK